MALPLKTQAELVTELSDETGYSKGDVKHFLQALEDIVFQAMKDCTRIKIAGVVVAPRVRAATKSRMGRNPRTGEDVKIKAKPANVKIGARVVKPLSDHKPSLKKLQTEIDAHAPVRRKTSAKKTTAKKGGKTAAKKKTGKKTSR